MVSTGYLVPLLGISAHVIPIGSWEPLAFLASGIFWWLSLVPHLLCYVPLFNFLTLCTSPPSSPTPGPDPIFCPHSHFLPSPSLLIHPVIILFPLLSRTEAFTFYSFFFLSFIWSMSCMVGILSFFPNIYLSVSTYHVCSFVIGLPHSGLYFLDPSICLRIS